MKKWSDKLIELSEEYLNYSGTRVKNLNGDFGLLNIDYDNKKYAIIVSNSDKILIFNSVQDMINNEWVVD